MWDEPEFSLVPSFLHIKRAKVVRINMYLLKEHDRAGNPSLRQAYTVERRI